MKWKIMALLAEQSQLHEFIHLEDIRPKGATVWDVLEVLKDAGMSRVGMRWTPGEGTCDWLCRHLHGVS